MSRRRVDLTSQPAAGLEIMNSSRSAGQLKHAAVAAEFVKLAANSHLPPDTTRQCCCLRRVWRGGVR